MIKAKRAILVIVISAIMVYIWYVVFMATQIIQEDDLFFKDIDICVVGC